MAGSRIARFLASDTIAAAGRFTDLIATTAGRQFSALVGQRLYSPVGMHRTALTPDGQFHSNVDELYRFSLGLDENRVFLSDSARSRNGSATLDTSLGWMVDTFDGAVRHARYALPDGRRSAFLRLPGSRTTVIVLTDDDSVNAKAIAESLARGW